MGFNSGFKGLTRYKKHSYMEAGDWRKSLTCRWERSCVVVRADNRCCTFWVAKGGVPLLTMLQPFRSRHNPHYPWGRRRQVPSKRCGGGGGLQRKDIPQWDIAPCRTAVSEDCCPPIFRDKLPSEDEASRTSTFNLEFWVYDTHGWTYTVLWLCRSNFGWTPPPPPPTVTNICAVWTVGC